MARNEARKPHQCPHCDRRFTPREMEIDEAFDDHLREAHSDVVIMPPENFFYLNEAEKEEKRRRSLGRFLSSALDPEPGD